MQKTLLLTSLASCLLIGCKPKPKQAPTIPVIVTVPDTLRLKLEQQAQTNRQQANAARSGTQQTVTDYQSDAKTYDSLQVDL